MAEARARRLKMTAFVLAALLIGFAVYEKMSAQQEPSDRHYHAANTLFEDERYDEAAEAYRLALNATPDHAHARRGLARSLHKLGRHQEALRLYDEAIGKAPANAGIYANRGILLDTMGRHEAALSDYETALGLDPDLAEGPGWLTRFLRNQAQAPATIADRAAYLQAELARPTTEQVLRRQEKDALERPYRK